MEIHSADTDDAARLYQKRLGREVFAEAAYNVGVWINWAVPLEDDPSLRTATVLLSYRFGLAQMAATDAVREAIAKVADPASPQYERDFADWKDYVFPTFFERWGRPVRSATAHAIQGDVGELVAVSAYYASIERGLDYRSPLDWADLESRIRIDQAVSECSSAAGNVETGVMALAPVRAEGQTPPWGTVPPAVRAVEREMYHIGLAHSRLVFALRAAVRASLGLPPLPIPAPPSAVDASGFPVDAEGNAMAIPPPPVFPQVAHPPDPWPEAHRALEAGASRIQTALLAALADPTPRFDVALQLGRQWSAYPDIIGGLPLGSLAADDQSVVLALANEVAQHAQSVVSAVDALNAQ